MNKNGNSAKVTNITRLKNNGMYRNYAKKMRALNNKPLIKNIKMNKLPGILSAIGVGLSAMEVANLNKQRESGEIVRGTEEDKRRKRQSLVGLYSGIGGMIGTAIPIPVLGSLIGSGIGALVGLGHSAINNKANRDAYVLKSYLKHIGISLNGDYKKRELDSISKLVKDDKKISYAEYKTLNKDLQVKLLENKDYQIPSWVKENKKEKGGLLNGPSHANGGMHITGSNIEVEGGEYIINKESSKKYLGLLEAINENKIIKPRVSENQMPLHVKPITNKNYGNIDNKLNINPINLDISGTIKLEGSQGQNLDITKELLKNPVFINSLTSLIEKELTLQQRGGNITTRGLK